MKNMKKVKAVEKGRTREIFLILLLILLMTIAEVVEFSFNVFEWLFTKKCWADIIWKV